VVPAYNAARYIGDALASARSQTLPIGEVIVVDDGSTDDTAAIARAAGAYVITQRNARQAAARNAGVRAARGEVVAFLDADDVWLPNKLDEQLRLLAANPRLGFVSCNYFEMDAGGARGREVRPGLRDDALEAILLGRGHGPPSTLLVPRKILDEVGPFDETLPPCEDTDLSWRIAARYPVDLVAECLVGYRLHPQNSHKRLDATTRAWLLLYAKALSDPLVRRRGWVFRRRCLARLNTMLAGDHAQAGQVRAAVRFGARALTAWPPAAGRLVIGAFRRTLGPRAAR